MGQTNGAFNYKKKRELRKLLNKIDEPTGLTVGDILKRSEDKMKVRQQTQTDRTKTDVKDYVYSGTAKISKDRLLRKVKPKAETSVEINLEPEEEQ